MPPPRKYGHRIYGCRLFFRIYTEKNRCQFLYDNKRVPPFSGISKSCGRFSIDVFSLRVIYEKRERFSFFLFFWYFIRYHHIIANKYDIITDETRTLYSAAGVSLSSFYILIYAVPFCHIFVFPVRPFFRLVYWVIIYTSACRTVYVLHDESR